MCYYVIVNVIIINIVTAIFFINLLLYTYIIELGILFIHWYLLVGKSSMGVKIKLNNIIKTSVAYQIQTLTIKY